MSRSEEQTTRTPPEGFDGYGAAPAGQRVVDVNTPAVRGVGLKAGIGEDLHADNLRTPSGYCARFSPGLLLRVQPAPVIRVFFSKIHCATLTFVLFQRYIVTLKLASPVPANTEIRCIPAYSSAYSSALAR